ncbi:MATH and LRR domain-containing protein PFE0570w-like, partial [Musca vetustissima]|uniref:MATH and LRR domain-containing protein PFE0570w-like n=1 Tax=Musca vetustissima TaxID=27455 RepID=UPI002AB6D90C
MESHSSISVNPQEMPFRSDARNANVLDVQDRGFKIDIKNDDDIKIEDTHIEMDNEANEDCGVQIKRELIDEGIRTEEKLLEDSKTQNTEINIPCIDLEDPGAMKPSSSILSPTVIDLDVSKVTKSKSANTSPENFHQHAPESGNLSVEENDCFIEVKCDVLLNEDIGMEEQQLKSSKETDIICIDLDNVETDLNVQASLNQKNTNNNNNEENVGAEKGAKKQKQPFEYLKNLKTTHKWVSTNYKSKPKRVQKKPSKEQKQKQPAYKRKVSNSEYMRKFYDYHLIEPQWNDTDRTGKLREIDTDDEVKIFVNDETIKIITKNEHNTSVNTNNPIYIDDGVNIVDLTQNIEDDKENIPTNSNQRNVFLKSDNDYDDIEMICDLSASSGHSKSSQGTSTCSASLVNSNIQIDDGLTIINVEHLDTSETIVVGDKKMSSTSTHVNHRESSLNESFSCRENPYESKLITESTMQLVAKDILDKYLPVARGNNEPIIKTDRIQIHDGHTVIDLHDLVDVDIDTSSKYYQDNMDGIQVVSEISLNQNFPYNCDNNNTTNGKNNNNTITQNIANEDSVETDDSSPTENEPINDINLDDEKGILDLSTTGNKSLENMQNSKKPQNNSCEIIDEENVLDLSITGKVSLKNLQDISSGADGDKDIHNDIPNAADTPQAIDFSTTVLNASVVTAINSTENAMAALNKESDTDNEDNILDLSTHGKVYLVEDLTPINVKPFLQSLKLANININTNHIPDENTATTINIREDDVKKPSNNSQDVPSQILTNETTDVTIHLDSSLKSHEVDNQNNGPKTKPFIETLSDKKKEENVFPNKIEDESNIKTTIEGNDRPMKTSLFAHVSADVHDDENDTPLEVNTNGNVVVTTFEEICTSKTSDVKPAKEDDKGINVENCVQNFSNESTGNFINESETNKQILNIIDELSDIFDDEFDMEATNENHTYGANELLAAIDEVFSELKTSKSPVGKCVSTAGGLPLEHNAENDYMAPRTQKKVLNDPELKSSKTSVETATSSVGKQSLDCKIVSVCKDNEETLEKSETNLNNLKVVEDNLEIIATTENSMTSISEKSLSSRSQTDVKILETMEDTNNNHHVYKEFDQTLQNNDVIKMSTESLNKNDSHPYAKSLIKSNNISIKSNINSTKYLDKDVNKTTKTCETKTTEALEEDTEEISENKCTKSDMTDVKTIEPKSNNMQASTNFNAELNNAPFNLKITAVVSIPKQEYIENCELEQNRNINELLKVKTEEKFENNKDVEIKYEEEDAMHFCHHDLKPLKDECNDDSKETNSVNDMKYGDNHSISEHGLLTGASEVKTEENSDDFTKQKYIELDELPVPDIKDDDSVNLDDGEYMHDNSEDSKSELTTLSNITDDCQDELLDQIEITTSEDTSISDTSDNRRIRKKNLFTRPSDSVYFKRPPTKRRKMEPLCEKRRKINKKAKK